ETDPGVADLPFSVRRFASGPEPALGPETDALETVPVMLSAPVPSPAAETSTGVTGPEPVGAEPDEEPPIFQSVRSGYLSAFGRDVSRFGERQAGQSPAGRPARPPASWGDGSGRAAAGPPTAPHPAFSGLPQRVPQLGQARSAAADQEARHDGAAQDPAAQDPAAQKAGGAGREAAEVPPAAP